MLDDRDFHLRPVRLDDAELLLRWRNSDRVRSMMFSDHAISPQEHQAWIERILGSPESRHYIFEHLSRPIGSVNVTKIDPERGTCYAGYYVGESDAPKGSGAVMGRLMLREIFGALGMQEVFSEVFAFNEPSLKFLQRLGFEEVPGARTQRLKAGRVEEVIAMSLKRERSAAK